MLGIASALPFVGFGFLDNFLMIVSGEFIDSTLCVFFSFSTMAAAAIGNTISDAAGIFSGGAVEQLAMRCGVEEPPLTRAQRQMRVTRVWLYMGQVVGILAGCALGCCPLLWLDPGQAARLKEEKQQNAIFQGVVDKVAEMLQAEAAELIMVDRERGDLYSRNVTSNLRHHRWRLSDGFIGPAATTGRFVNVADVQDEPCHDPALHDNFLGTGIQVQSLLCMPVFSKGEVSGLIVVINKKDGAFTTRDEDVLSAISTHVAVAIGDSRQNFEEVLENCEKSMTQQGAPQWNTNTTRRRKTLFTPVLKGMGALLGAESTALMLLDEEHGELYTEATEGSLPKHRVKLGMSFAGWAVERGLVLNVVSDSNSHFEPAQYRDYQGSGVDVRSVLCVPIFDTHRKCLGAFECINKQRGGAFDAEDVQYVQQVANYIALMLEGPTAELRRVLALTHQRIQHKLAMQNTGESHEPTVVCFLEQAQDLPRAPGAGAGGGEPQLGPYVTLQVVRGDPLRDEATGARVPPVEPQGQGAAQRLDLSASRRDEPVRPSTLWDETVAVPVPAHLRDVPAEELYLHVLLWDEGSPEQGRLVAQASFQLALMPRTAARGAQPFRLHPIADQEGIYDLEKARIWLSFSRGDS